MSAEDYLYISAMAEVLFRMVKTVKNRVHLGVMNFQSHDDLF